MLHPHDLKFKKKKKKKGKLGRLAVSYVCSGMHIHTHRHFVLGFSLLTEMVQVLLGSI